MRKYILFNDNWQFAAQKLNLDASDDLFESITLPHPNKIFPHHNVDNEEYQFISTYRKKFFWRKQPESEASAKIYTSDDSSLVFLDFDGVMLACTVYLNGRFLSEHVGGYAPFSVEITNTLQEGENILTLHVDSRERKDVPPYGHLVDYLTFGGIYRDVHLRLVNPIHIENTFIQTLDVVENPRLVCDVRLNHFKRGLSLEAIVIDAMGSEIASIQRQVEHQTARLEFEALPDAALWSIERPTLYSLKVSLIYNNKPLDTLSSRFGFRQAEFCPDGGFYLNGERINLLGLNRHQTYPYIGAAAPARLQRQDADILKYELACNIVRTSHYLQSPHFLDRCDEIGLLVFEEITGWQHVGDEKWQAICLAELETMIERDRNRPSIVLWGVRVNESGDNDDFYGRTNTLAHQLDPTRQTGGVRDFLGSSFLEDVYTHNDFSNGVRIPTEQPHLITEFAGHMLPTKIWDHEERLIEQALLHAKIHNLQLGDEKIAGAIGWCAFDYATHIEFGSGDRICYHGVMDIFRLPKWAAYLYQSQQSPSKKIVLHAATHWTMGDRNGGGNNPLTVFSNCEEIEIIIGKISVGKFQPAFDIYPHLDHPPFIIGGLDAYSAWGQSEFYDLHLISYLQGKPVSEQWISSNRLPKRLELFTDSGQLQADGADMTRLVFRITDKFGNPLPYATKVVTFELEGDADLIGENPFPLIGGQAALYIKAHHQPGTVIIRAHVPGLPSTSAALEIISASDFEGQRQER
ncbi:MAG: glycoside hydrolase family 2 protein [Ardenticatenaceae bacterium]|nr:glycoside hydrolase family 2 protein [Ardenticatenaceae bacterium]